MAGSGLIVTMAPQTIDMLNASSDYLATALKIKDILTVVNTQYYNSGSMNGCDGGVYSQGTVDFITSMVCTAIQAGLAPSQVGVGLPASPSAAGSGYISPTVVNNALDCLTKGTGCGSFKPAGHLAGAARRDDLVDQLGRLQRQLVRQRGRHPRARAPVAPAPARHTAAPDARSPRPGRPVRRAALRSPGSAVRPPRSPPPTARTPAPSRT